MFLFRRLYNSLRVPGEQMDSIISHFKTASEGDAPRNFIIIGKGRIFSVNFYNDDGTIMHQTQILAILTEISGIIQQSDVNVPIPVLTCDDRSSWASVRRFWYKFLSIRHFVIFSFASQNRKYLKELSSKNEKLLRLIEESITVLTLDEHNPGNWDETALHTISGDLHSKWADKSCSIVSFNNGRFGSTGDVNNFGIS